MTIVAEDMEIAAHRVVLAACSPYFHAMFTGTRYFLILVFEDNKAALKCEIINIFFC